ncbi:MAG TPA: ABC transporter substrate-binding protein [Conexibacter sp.]|jgi:peptide/nickel transport system substrate-binding protein
MPRTAPARALVAGLLCLALVPALAACGSGEKNSATSTTATTDNGSGGRRGGTLKVLSEEDFGNLDPGNTYSSAALELLSAVDRPLYSYAPNNPTDIVPDLAAAAPKIAPDGKTVTVRIRSGVHFGPPVNREVTSRDVKYAIERGFNPSVANGYAPTYYGDVIGAARATGGPIIGIETPDPHTIVFRLTRPTGTVLAQATTLPLSAPVPQEYAARFDDVRGTSEYGNHQVATGPYMFAADRDGNELNVGITPNRGVRLVRNPNWSASTDDRPAYLDEIDWSVGNDPNIAGRQVLDGNDMSLGDTPTAAIVKRAVENNQGQIYFSPGAGSRYAALNTQIPPFDNADVRKALAAALDRDQMRLVRGGAMIGDIATHFLYPGVAGFDEAGGMRGPGYDFLASPAGDPAVARKYMVAAGYPSGRYTGDQTIDIVGDSGDPSNKDAELVEDAARSLGFKTKLRLLDSNVMYEQYCAVPRARVEICPTVGWSRDFADPQTVLDAAFNGATIAPKYNSNWPQLDDPRINAAMKQAEVVVDQQERARAWANIDRMVTSTAAAIPWLWDRQPVVSSADVRCAYQLWNQGHCDLAYSSLK